MILSARPARARTRTRSIVDVRLDPAQAHVARLPPGRHTLLLGEAGHGKTTVAMHRLAHLVRQGARRALVLVPTEGLRELLARMATRLGVDVPVMLYETWARRQARRAFPDVPKREGCDANAAVVATKRDPSLRVALDALAARPPGRIDDDVDAEEQASPAWARRADLQHLFGDQRLLEAVASASIRPLARAQIADVLTHTRVQFERTTENASAHIDRERLVTVDGMAIDVGTPDADAGTIDAEDYAVLFELDRFRAARAGAAPTAPRAYDCIVVDEAQELAPLELALVGRSLSHGGTLVIAGDAEQQIDPASGYTSWSRTMEELGCDSYETHVLEIGYRCPPEVVAFARGLRAGGAPGAPLPLATFADEPSLVAWLSRELAELERKDPRAEAAIICRTPLTARRLARMLRASIPCKLVLDGAFTHGIAVQITTVDQVKGLELDHVIVPDATAAAYPDTPDARRALYVAVTRARHQAVLVAAGPVSPVAQSSCR